MRYLFRLLLLITLFCSLANLATAVSNNNDELRNYKVLSIESLANTDNYQLVITNNSSYEDVGAVIPVDAFNNEQLRDIVFYDSNGAQIRFPIYVVCPELSIRELMYLTDFLRYVEDNNLSVSRFYVILNKASIRLLQDAQYGFILVKHYDGKNLIRWRYVRIIKVKERLVTVAQRLKNIFVSRQNLTNANRRLPMASTFEYTYYDNRGYLRDDYYDNLVRLGVLKAITRHFLFSFRNNSISVSGQSDYWFELVYYPDPDGHMLDIINLTDSSSLAEIFNHMLRVEPNTLYQGPYISPYQMTEIYARDPNSNNNEATRVIGARISFCVMEDNKVYTYTLYIMFDLNIPDNEFGDLVARGVGSSYRNRIFRVFLYRRAALVSTYYTDLSALYNPYSLRSTSAVAESEEYTEKGLHEVALENHGIVTCSGDNRVHQCGPSLESYIYTPIPVSITNNGKPVTITKVLATKHGSFFLSSSGDLYAMGDNGESGQKYLGLANNGFALSPTQVNLPIPVSDFVDQYMYNKDMVALFSRSEKKQIIAFGLKITSNTQGSLPVVVTPANYTSENFVSTINTACYKAVSYDGSELIRQCFGNPYLDKIPGAKDQFYDYLHPFVELKEKLPAND